MQKKRPRSKGEERNGSGAVSPAPAESGSTRRPVRVRSRLVAGVAVVGVTVIAAGAPMVLTASSELNDSQRLVTLAELNQQAVALAHALADERDDVTARIAAGRDGKTGADDTRSTRVDQRVEEIRAAAPAALRRDLAGIPSLRREALSGKGTALEAHQAYSEIIGKLQDLAEELTEKTPPRAAGATRASLALARATEQAAATRGLLLAALSVPGGATTPQTDPVTGLPVQNGSSTIDPATGLPVQSQDGASAKDDRTRDELSAAAQLARVRELGALADFDQVAGATARDKLASTVTGPEVAGAEKYLNRLTARPELSESGRATNRKKAGAALSARIDRMRSVESALGTERVGRLEQLRDDDVTALELRIALLGGCLLIAVGVSTAVARTLTQPLAVLRIGAARLATEPETAEPVRYTGRNDEYAQVVRSLNSLHARLQGLLTQFNGRFADLEGERGELAAGREALAAQRAELRTATAELTAELEQLKNTVHHTFVNLSLRTLGLVDRQLGVIEGLEDREQDPERLATLFKLDHMATVMRRHSENMLVLAGAEHGHGHAGPIPLVDVARAAVSEIERYERVVIQALPPHAQVAGFAADDLSHLLAELLENATAFSPPESRIQLSGWLLESGEVMLSVQDDGLGMPADRMAELNARLADPTLFEAGDRSAEGAGLGLQVTALLAARHGVRVELREHTGSGLTAVVVLPKALLPEALPAATPPPAKSSGSAPALNLPGSVAEANSNALPARTPSAEEPQPQAASGEQQPPSGDEEPPATAPEPRPAEARPSVEARPSAGESRPSGEQPAEDPLIAAAERAIRASGAGSVPAPSPEPSKSPAPAESESEVTLQVRLPVVPKPAGSPRPEAADPYAIGPDRHERTPDQPRDRIPEQRTQPPAEAASAAPAEPAAPAGRVTDKGLPKRTPRITKPAAAATTERKGNLDKEALRRRLGGFHQGAKDGRRDVEAEIAEGHPAPHSTPADQHSDAARPGSSMTDQTDETGDTVEEARS
ncbi:nitrate- and nitrite sensing domain-containing protein [Streptomyces sp. NPDC052095]|uniref:nitrate- and nitrite sensing domain-containing protein n=1 Tax=unclassified Streptomyces TaxID=2593676 RepID=UPI00344B76FD